MCVVNRCINFDSCLGILLFNFVSSFLAQLCSYFMFEKLLDLGLLLRFVVEVCFFVASNAWLNLNCIDELIMVEFFLMRKY